MALPGLLLLLLVAVVSPCAAQRPIAAPFETAEKPEPANPIGTEIIAALSQQGIEPARQCSDGVFVRRAYVSLIGTLPTRAEARAFIDSNLPGKRARLIDALMERPEFADYLTMKWADVLRVRAEFPINLWPNAAQAYHRWIHDQIRTNRPYDKFARELLTSSGSNFRVPAVNFYRATQSREPAAIAASVALTFMGTRMAEWPQEERTNLEAFFSRVGFKLTEEWKEEVVHLDPKPVEPFEATFPDGTTVTIGPDEDPRDVFTDWLITPENAWFTRSIVNRVWAWLFGRGIVHEPDDIRTDNPPLYPGVLTYLEGELVQSGYDLRHLIRVITGSNTYQQSPIPSGDTPDAAARFACYPVQRLDAEVLSDALRYLGGVAEQYTSDIPEPFTYIPWSHRAISLADGSITTSFLEMFGRPARDSGLFAERSSNATDAQRLYMLNSTDIQNAVRNSPHLQQIIGAHQGDRPKLISELYLLVLSRYPTEEETAAVSAHFEATGLGLPEGVADIAWALINTREFLYRH